MTPTLYLLAAAVASLVSSVRLVDVTQKPLKLLYPSSHELVFVYPGQPLRESAVLFTPPSPIMMGEPARHTQPSLVDGNGNRSHRSRLGEVGISNEGSFYSQGWLGACVYVGGGWSMRKGRGGLVPTGVPNAPRVFLCPLIPRRVLAAGGLGSLFVVLPTLLQQLLHTHIQRELPPDLRRGQRWWLHSPAWC